MVGHYWIDTAFSVVHSFLSYLLCLTLPWLPPLLLLLSSPQTLTFSSLPNSLLLHFLLSPSPILPIPFSSLYALLSILHLPLSKPSLPELRYFFSPSPYSPLPLNTLTLRCKNLFLFYVSIDFNVTCLFACFLVGLYFSAFFSLPDSLVWGLTTFAHLLILYTVLTELWTRTTSVIVKVLFLLAAFLNISIHRYVTCCTM